MEKLMAAEIKIEQEEPTPEELNRINFLQDLFLLTLVQGGLDRWMSEENVEVLNVPILVPKDLHSFIKDFPMTNILATLMTDIFLRGIMASLKDRKDSLLE